jgi:hypothetical protein
MICVGNVQVHITYRQCYRRGAAGHYAGGRGSSHKGEHYENTRTGGHYETWLTLQVTKIRSPEGARESLRLCAELLSRVSIVPVDI